MMQGMKGIDSFIGIKPALPEKAGEPAVDGEKSASAKEDKKGFDQELVQAALFQLLQMQSPAMQSVLGAAPRELAPGESLQTESVQGLVSGQVTGLKDGQPFVGVKAEAAFAGLKPWTRDWIGHGRPELDTLEGAIKQMSLMDLLQSSETMPQQVTAAESLSGRPELTPGTGQNAEQLLANSKMNSMESSPLSDQLNSLLLRDSGQVLNPGVSQGVIKRGEVTRESPSMGDLTISGDEFLRMRAGEQVVAPLGGGKGSGQGGLQQGPQAEISVLTKADASKESNADAVDAKRSFSFAHPEALQTQGGISQPASQPGRLVTTEVSGQVVSGSMARPRLSTDSLMGMTSGIQGFLRSGGGEIRVRLKPENLGEISLRVVTQGNQVGLQVQASSEKAKSVLEESMAALKESLSSQNLTLARVDLSVTPPSSASLAQHDLGQRGDSSGQRRESLSHFQSQLQERSEGGTRRPLTMAPQFAQRSPLAGSGRLDVRA